MFICLKMSYRYWSIPNIYVCVDKTHTHTTRTCLSQLWTWLSYDMFPYLIKTYLPFVQTVIIMLMASSAKAFKVGIPTGGHEDQFLNIQGIWLIWLPMHLRLLHLGRWLNRPVRFFANFETGSHILHLRGCLVKQLASFLVSFTNSCRSSTQPIGFCMLLRCLRTFGGGDLTFSKTKSIGRWTLGDGRGFSPKINQNHQHSSPWKRPCQHHLRRFSLMNSVKGRIVHVEPQTADLLETSTGVVQFACAQVDCTSCIGRHTYTYTYTYTYIMCFLYIYIHIYR